LPDRFPLFLQRLSLNDEQGKSRAIPAGHYICLAANSKSREEEYGAIPALWTRLTESGAPLPEASYPFAQRDLLLARADTSWPIREIQQLMLRANTAPPAYLSM
jgi:hypothetical protein